MQCSYEHESHHFFFPSCFDGILIGFCRWLMVYLVQVLIRMLPSYYQHVFQYKNSLVTKFFGVHCVKPVGGQKV